MDGWVGQETNTLGIQGAIYAAADDTTALSMTSSFVGSNACIQGTAAQVDLLCTPPVGMDCYGLFWGAAISLNLNQPIDPETMMGVDPLPYDATALTGFALEISGAVIPTSLRFKVENANGEYCTRPATPVGAGMNTFQLSQLFSECWTAAGTSAENAKSSLIRISWQVVTNAETSVPFDFCVSDIQALQ